MSRVQTGLEVLIGDYPEKIRGARIGVVCHPSNPNTSGPVGTSVFAINASNTRLVAKPHQRARLNAR